MVEVSVEVMSVMVDVAVELESVAVSGSKCVVSHWRYRTVSVVWMVKVIVK